MITGEESILNFTGFVDRIDGDTAFLILTSEDDGEVTIGEYPAAKLAELGIHERRRFKLRVVSYTSFEAIPDREISEEREREVHDMIATALGGIAELQDNY